MIARIRAWWRLRQARLATDHLDRAEMLLRLSGECAARGDLRGAARLHVEFLDAIHEAEARMGEEAA